MLCSHFSVDDLDINPTLVICQAPLRYRNVIDIGRIGHRFVQCLEEMVSLYIPGLKIKISN